jgi:hypothetical protein
MDDYEDQLRQVDTGYEREWGAIRARQQAAADNEAGRSAFLLIGAAWTWQVRHYSRATVRGQRWYATWSSLSLGSLAGFFLADGNGLRGAGLAALLASWLACWLVALLGIA